MRTFSFSRTFYMLCVDHCPSLADRFHSSGPQVDFSVHSRFACGPFSPRADLFLFLAWHTRGQYSIKLTDLCPPRADLFRSRGPFICYGRTFFPRSRTVFIHRDPEWTFLVTRALVRTILSASGPFYIACVAHVVSILFRLLVLHTRTVFYQTNGRVPAARGPFSFARTFHLLWADL